MTDFPYSRVHLCGIGGAGVSGLARILLEMGIRVTGSDSTPSPVTAELERQGALIVPGEAAESLPPDTELLIHSAAIRPWHPQRRLAAVNGIPELKYAQALGRLTALRDTITVAGTHGKTSTTNLITTLLLHGGKNPGWVVGGVPQNLQANSHWGTGQHFVVEACEYDHSFLNLSPKIAILHNVEPDHLDYFRSFDGVKRAFRAYISRLPSDGVLFANWDDPVVRELADTSRRRVVRYGFSEGAMYRPENLSFHEGFARFSIAQGRRELTEVRLPAPGKTNVINAIAAAAVALSLGVTADAVSDALSAPIGVKRRFELLARVKGVPIIDDYAHHPTAVRELVVAARAAFPTRKLTFVFQAHQYGRLNGFFGEFADALSGVDRVIICRTYAARESGVKVGEPEERLAVTLRERGTAAESVASFDEAIERIWSSWSNDGAVFSVGAGDVNEVAIRLAEQAGAVSAPLRAAESYRGPRLMRDTPIDPQSVSSMLRLVDELAEESATGTAIPASMRIPGLPSARMAAFDSAQLAALDSAKLAAASARALGLTSSRQDASARADEEVGVPPSSTAAPISTVAEAA